MTDVELVNRYRLLHAIDRETFPEQSESGLRTRRKELVDARVVADTQIRKRVVGHGPAIVWGLAP